MLKTILIFTAITFLVIGCGKSDNAKERVMKIGESYSVSQGDVIVKGSEKATIRVVHILDKETSTVSLVEGNATITHPKQK